MYENEAKMGDTVMITDCRLWTFGKRGRIIEIDFDIHKVAIGTAHAYLIASQFQVEQV
jgi:hypothetical protein